MSKVVVQVCCGDWGGPAQANTARKTLPLPSKHLFQCLEGTKKESVLGEDMGCGGEVKAQNSQGWCRGVGRDMMQVDSKFGARPQPVSQARRRKVVVTVREKHSEKKKRQKTKKNTEKKKKKMSFFFLAQKWPRPPALPIKPLGLPFGP